GTERKAAAHLGFHDRTRVAARRRELRQQVTPRLALHIVVTLHLHFGDLDGRVLAQGEIEGLGKRQPHLRRSACDAGGPKAEDQKKSFHHYSENYIVVVNYADDLHGYLFYGRLPSPPTAVCFRSWPV